MSYGDQQPKGGVVSVLDDIRRAIHEGHLVREEWDPNNSRSAPHRSNKRVMLAAKLLLGRPAQTPDEAWSVVIETVIGPKPVDMR